MVYPVEIGWGVDVDGSGRDSVPPVDLRLWGKSKGLPRPYPLICHLIDSGAATEVLWRDVLPRSARQVIADGLSVSVADAGRLLAFWTALHDIGKVIPGFQMQAREAFARLSGYSTAGARRDFGHDGATHLFLGRVLSELGYVSGLTGGASATRVAQILGGHHGCFYKVDSREFDSRLEFPALGAGEWEIQRRAVLDAVTGVFAPPPAPKTVGLESAALICGLVILADWLVSQEDFLTERLDDLPAGADLPALCRHRTRSAEYAVELVGDAGLGRLALQGGSFAQEFPAYPPNALQCSVAEGLPPLLFGPGLLLVMAPMGMGKTEAALHAARLMGDAAGTAGLFMTLPTMATSDQMYERILAYVQRRAEPDVDTAVTLLHSMAWLNPAYAPEPGGGSVVTGDDDPTGQARTAATAWLRGRKRGLLAPLAVGTVDQALLTVLPVRHNVLRMLGLAGKVLIVDEVHAYDAYMQYLLARLLTWLGALKVPVVLLSATLPSSVAERLVRAYLYGARGRRYKAPLEVAYPGWVYADATSATVTTRVFDVPPRPPLALDLVDIPARVKDPSAAEKLLVDDGVDRSAALRSLLAPIFRDGGCVMVVCTTVAEAQDTFTAIAAWKAQETAGARGDGTDDSGPVLELLHARLPAREREKRTARVTAAFGREVEHRPSSAILVATQVAEQSLDFDFDLVVSDLAPVAQLLQRAGRCQRHPQVDDAGLRPKWAAKDPRLAVFLPRGEDRDLVLPQRWTGIYDHSLLRRTYDVLVKKAGSGVAIPADVQPMVEEVYDETFHENLVEAEINRLMEDEARVGIAEMVAVKAPAQLRDLEPLTTKEIDEDRVSTRLGAESVRVVCCYVDTDGDRWLDPGRTRRLPESGVGPAGRFTPAQVRAILGESIPLRDGEWRRRDRDVTAPPPAWSDNATLRELLLLPHLLGLDGTVSPVEIGGRTFRLDPTLGLVG